MLSAVCRLSANWKVWFPQLVTLIIFQNQFSSISLSLYFLNSVFLDSLVSVISLRTQTCIFKFLDLWGSSMVVFAAFGDFPFSSIGKPPVFCVWAFGDLRSGCLGLSAFAFTSDAASLDVVVWVPLF